MVDKIEAQSVDFLGEAEQFKKTTSSKFKEEVVVDMDTQIAIGELQKNYNQMVNNMLSTCANICIKNFNGAKLSDTESICVDNCQKKFYSTYAVGEKFVRLILEEANKTDIFSNSNQTNIIENAANKLKY